MTTAIVEHERQTAIKGTEKFMTYDFNKVNKVAELASDEIETFLLSLPETMKVTNVEKDRMYQIQDIDLLWYVRSKKTGKIEKKTIEIKGDRYYHTGNYFFETVSNTTKNTPGCFMITEADFIFYYFVDKKLLHILPTIETREWFIKNQDRYKEAKTSTSSPNKLLYTSLGKKVPRKHVRENCNVTILDISSYI